MPFENIRLNRNNVRYLKNAIENDRLHHSLLFEGPEGVGKMEMALETAKALNCSGPDRFGRCSCRSCEQISRMVFSDVKVVEAEPEKKVIQVEAVRRVIREMSFAPYEGKKRVYIIKDADKMNPESANTLLKSLEEPPPHVQFILVTAHPYVLLPTIRSRCQRVTFQTLGPGQMTGLLPPSEGEEQRRLRSMLSGGSLNRAMEMDLARYEAKREMALKLLAIFAVRGPDRLDPSLLTAPDTWLDLARDLEELLGVFFLLLRDILVLASAGDRDHLVNRDLEADLLRFAERLPPPQTLQAMREVTQLLDHLRRLNLNKRVAYDALLVSLDAIARGRAA
jgi:DNA polymerase-3 subunit delta'